MRQMRISRIVAAGALLLPYATVMAQGIKEVLHGQGPATTLAPKDLPDDYRAVRIAVTASQSDTLLGYAPLFSLADSSSRTPDMISRITSIAGDSWTNGDIFTIEGERFLVTYVLGLDQLALALRGNTSPETASEAPSQGPSNPKWPAPRPLAFTLKLVKVSSIESIAPDPQWTKADILRLLDANGGMAEIAEQNNQKQTFSNIKQIALATMLYASDYDDVTPYVQNTKTVQTVTAPYVKNMDVWKTLNPNGGRILFNIALGGVATSSIPAPAEAIMYYESNPWPDGRRCVAFADGHAKIVDEPEWLRLKVTLITKYKRTAARPLPLQ